ncbi:MAG: aminotransferase [Ruminococcus sp.]|nr:aminotransferase [Ruminococcus sp.]MCD7800421.1 aminotransferase [Ruminococcus sp.]
MKLSEMNKDELTSFKNSVQDEYDAFKSLGLKLNMARGKPSSEQLDLSMPMLDVLSSTSELNDLDGVDVRNYGGLEGIPEARKLMGDILGVKSSEILVYGNASLKAMYDTIARSYCFGVLGSTPWCKLDKVKFLCPVPGYDRHFAITEQFGIEMINIPMTQDGPDMDMVETFVNNDESVKGIWCVPQYSNPSGISYSDETVKRFANLSPKAEDFRIFWDNAYCIHHLVDEPKCILNIMDECKNNGKEDMVYIFGSTSKVTFSGAGISAIGCSEKNLKEITDKLTKATIGYDKVNQLRHCKFFGDIDGVKQHMKKHAEILKPKFDCVISWLDKEIAPLGIGSWIEPQGGYFVSFDSQSGCAKRIVQLCKDAGVVLTGAGATYPYGKDPQDSNIRIAPSYPPVEELEKAMELFCICVKLATAEKLLAE